VSGRLASRVLCATLAVPLPVARNQSDQLLDLDDGGVEKQKRLANLLSLSSLPTRQTLVKELVSSAVNCIVHGRKTWFSKKPIPVGCFVLVFWMKLGHYLQRPNLMGFGFFLSFHTARY